MKIVDHASWGLVQYNFSNDTLGAVRAYGIALKSQITVQTQRMIRHYVYVSLSCDRRGRIAAEHVGLVSRQGIEAEIQQLLREDL